MYTGPDYPNFHRPYISRNQNVRPEGHYYQGNNYRSNHSGQLQNTNDFQHEEYKYWCETCDKGFRFANQLENHKLQHQKCNIDGCQYVAHPKVITRHIQMQHSSGLFKKISKLNNPEEIKKWRDERRMKYPTKENIEKKKAEISERIKRGEKMGMKHERSKKRYEKTDYTNKRKPHQAQQRSNNLKRKLTSDVPRRSEQDKKICKIVPPIEETRTLKPFAGIQNLFDDDEEEIIEETSNILIEDDDDFTEKVEEIKETKLEPSICGALTSLLCQYGSSDEEDIQEKNMIFASSNTNIKSKDEKKINDKNDVMLTVNNNSETKPIINENNYSKILTKNIKKNVLSDDDSGPEETTIVKDENTTVTNTIKATNLPKNKKANLSKVNNSRHLNSIKRKRKLPSTLLEKLLHKEIQHERNIILQCIRHVVNNNFFDDKI